MRAMAASFLFSIRAIIRVISYGFSVSEVR